MARPKSNTPNKQKLTLTVSTQTRIELDFISQATGDSISAMIADWAAKESRRIARASKRDVPNAEQLKLD